MYNTKNRRFEITENIKNNDNNHNHIKPHLQNLILSYLPKGEDPEDRMSKGLPLRLAISASEMHNKLGETQSAIWCPLIYNALKKAGVSIPESWARYANSEKLEQFEELSEYLSMVPGWKEYVMYILTEYNDDVILRNEFDIAVFKQADNIRDSLR